MINNEKSRQDILGREEIKKMVENFLERHNEKELCVSVFLDSECKNSICNFHIASENIEIVEESTKSELIISDFASPMLSLIPDEVVIWYEEVVKCETTVRTGETKDDILADVLEITFSNSTILELGFLYI